jgi:hypothetical protein
VIVDTIRFQSVQMRWRWTEIEAVVRPPPSIPGLGALLRGLLAGLRTHELRFRSAPGIPMTVSARLLERLRSASGGALRTVEAG